MKAKTPTTTAKVDRPRGRPPKKKVEEAAPTPVAVNNDSTAVPVSEPAPSKYHRDLNGFWIDVYDILDAYSITNPGDQHAIKKMLLPGGRGVKTANQDREEAIVSLNRAVQLSNRSK